MPIHCEHCCDEIKYQNDLIVTRSLFSFQAYHARCYGLRAKRGSISLSQPINNTQGFVAPFVLFFVYLLLLLNSTFRSEPLLHIFWGFLILNTLFSRLYSYYKFEKQL